MSRLRINTTIFILIVTFPIPAIADVPLHGEIQKRGTNTRVSRPKSPQSGSVDSSSIESGMNEEKFALPMQTQNADDVGFAKDIQAAEKETKLRAVTEQTPLNSGVARSPEPPIPTKPEHPGAEVHYRPDGTTYTVDPARKHIVVRLKRYLSLVEVEVVEEALRTALKMLRRNVNVTILFDMEAVHAADPNFKFFDIRSTDEQQRDRIVPHSMIRKLQVDFMADGGKVMVSEHWAKVWGMLKSGGVTPGAIVASTDDIADELVHADSVIDY